jgi:chemotaxis protein methyltransferase CheR
VLNIALPEHTFKALRDYIYDKSGIYIADTKKYLIENRLSRVIHDKSLKNFEDYLQLLKHSSNGNELTRLFDAVTTNETYFFREPQQLNVFIESVYPEILKKKKGSDSIKLWSAACSSGEEPYTLSMMMREKQSMHSRYEIYASDLSEGVLNSAKNAVYNSYSVRNMPESYLNKYFSNSAHSYSLNDTVKKSVNFRKLNLIDSLGMKPLRGMDVIFCRNVLIYFDAKAKQKVVSNLYDSLNPGGYLFIGSSESLHNVTRAFRPRVIDKIIMYQKI